MTRAEAIKVLDEWTGIGNVEEDYCRVGFEANVLAVEGALYMAITALREQEQRELESPWISVKERLPEDSANVLVCHKNGLVTTNAWLGEYWWFKNEKNPITHWMPLPEPPKED